MYSVKLTDAPNKYSNAQHTPIKVKPIEVKSSTCIHFDKRNNNKDPKFEGGYHIRI